MRGATSTDPILCILYFIMFTLSKERYVHTVYYFLCCVMSLMFCPCMFSRHIKVYTLLSLIHASFHWSLLHFLCDVICLLIIDSRRSDHHFVAF